MAASSASSDSGLGATNGVENLCIICSEEPATDKILKDAQYMSVMDLYWKAAGADVKPELTKTFSLCTGCFDKLLEFYQINDVLVYFETRLRDLQNQILTKNVKGIIDWQAKGHPLKAFQTQIIADWGTKLEPINEESGTQSVLNTYQVTLTREDDPAEKNKKSPEKRSKRKKPGVVYIESEDDEDKDSNFSDENPSEAKIPKSNGNPPREKRSRTAKEKLNYSSSNDGSAEVVGSGTGSINTGERECKICLDTFSSDSQCNRHIAQHTVKEDSGLFECLRCPERPQFNRMAKFTEHKKSCGVETVE